MSVVDTVKAADAAKVAGVAGSVITPSGGRICFETYGAGPPLVLVHGAFSDHRTNWTHVSPLLAPHFTVLAVARRGRGQTDAATARTLEDEFRDVAAVIREVGRPVFLLGHSHGAHLALGAAALVPDLVRKLVLYEPPWPSLCDPEAMARLEALAGAGDWDGMAAAFFGDVLLVPRKDLEALRNSADWPPILKDAPATLEDFRALARYRFEPERFGGLTMPVLLQTGSESPELYTTDALAAVLPGATVGVLDGQAHEGMTTAPEQYAAQVRSFLQP